MTRENMVSITYLGQSAQKGAVDWQVLLHTLLWDWKEGLTPLFPELSLKSLSPDHQSSLSSLSYLSNL
jgi:hypothetical protein